MQRAIQETDRRRNKQREFNEVHGITPRSIVKAIHDIMEGAYSEGSVRGKLFPKLKVADASEDYASLSSEALTAKLAKLEQQMYNHAHHLEFEEAAAIRDKIHELKQNLLR
jgi:excinuclease ABC subunit B